MKNLKKFMRILCCLLAVCMVAGAFAACGESKKSETKPATEPAPGTVENPTGDPTVPVTPPEDEIKFDPAIDSDAEPIQLNIGTYNIANGRQVNHQMIKLAKDIVDQKLDIVGMQEVDQFCDRSGNMDTMKTMSELTGMPYYAFFKAINLAGNGAGGVGEYGVGVLSKYPILETERIELYSTGETRVLGRTKIDVNGTAINFFTTHLEWSPDATRYKQLDQFNDIFPKYDNFVVVGDFNVHTLSEYQRINYKGMVNTEEKPILTYSSTDGDWYLDNIIYSPEDWTFGEGKTLPNGKSDHFMLYATGVFSPKGKDVVTDKDGKELAALTDGKKSTSENIGKWAEGTKGAYVEIDLKDDHNVSAINVINATSCKNVYKWAVYGADDNSLPIEQWTKLAEKTSDDHATGLGYTAEVSEDGKKTPVRYIRIYATYHSEDENFRIAEISVTATAVVENKVDLTAGSKVTITTDAGKKMASLKDGDTEKYIKIGKWGEGTGGNYVEVDLGENALLNSLRVCNPKGDGDRVYKWVAYASADNTLSIDKWVKIGEKSGDEFADGRGVTVKIAKELRDTEFRYVRIYGTYYSGDENYHLTEVNVYGITVMNLRNLMGSATVSAGNGKNCDSIKDGNTGGYFDLGYWCDSDENKAAGIPVGTPGTCYVEIDLGKLCKVDQIRVVNLISATRVYKWEAFVTTDKSQPIDNWTSIGGKTDDKTSSEAGHTIELTDAAPFRYIRIYGMYHSANWGYHISEVFVFGEAAK